MSQPRTMEPPAVTPERILQVGMGFWASKVLLAAVKLDLFTTLGQGGMTEEALRAALGLHPRSSRDFLDALVSLGLLARADARYSNTPEGRVFLDARSPAYVGHMLLMANDRLWEFWGRLEQGLKTGRPQNETREGGWVLDDLYKDPAKRDLFLKAMIGLSQGPSMAAAAAYDFGRHKVFCDLGGGPGTLAAAVALAHPGVECVNFDLPPVEPVFKAYVERAGLAGRVRFHGGDCLQDPLPTADVYAMGHLLHGMGDADRRKALARAHAALPKGGALLVIEALIDEERSRNAFGLLMSLNMMVETPEGRNFTGGELAAWLADAGFQTEGVLPLGGPHSMAVARKR